MNVIKSEIISDLKRFKHNNYKTLSFLLFENGMAAGKKKILSVYYVIYLDIGPTCISVDHDQMITDSNLGRMLFSWIFVENLQ